MIEGDGVVYRGGFDDVELMRREGKGMEYDEKSGRVLRCGVWKNDELFQIEKECESEDVMIEYAIEEGKENVNKSVTQLVIPSKCCNRAEWSVFDVSGLKWLKSIEIGDECFGNVNEVKLIGLSELESVVIGRNCFTKKKNGYGNNPNRHFYLKNCSQLRELKIGDYSFSDYCVCKIENVPSLEVIEMGELKRESVNFYYASLELKSEIVID